MSVINSVGTLAAYTVDNMVKISLQIAVRLMFVAPWLYAVLLCGTVLTDSPAVPQSSKAYNHGAANIDLTAGVLVPPMHA